MQLPQSDLKAHADAAARIANPMYASNAEIPPMGESQTDYQSHAEEDSIKTDATFPSKTGKPLSSLTLFVGSCGAVGSAFGSHPRGRGFEPRPCHRSCALGKGALHDFPHFTQV
ncbi:hypothetical protein Bbelb_040390 [Branchiostoma belcheri]|nr:hypothetical protein Bbelb_040390 [Branchiostoma belcheri]